MRNVILAALAVVLAADSAAQVTILPTGDVRLGFYDMATDTFTEPNEAPTVGYPLWQNDTPEGYYMVMLDTAAAFPDQNLQVLDWGDMGHTGFSIGELQFAYFGNTPNGAADSGDVMFIFYGEENGHNSMARRPLAAFRLRDLPGVSNGVDGFGWLVTVSFRDAWEEVFDIYGNDWDDISGRDFGWQVWFLEDTWPTPSQLGIAIASGGQGDEDGLDLFGPTSSGDPNDFAYVTTDSFGGAPWAGLHLALYDYDGLHGDCPNPGWDFQWCVTDIAGEDCLVNLADLALLLSEYGGPGPVGDFDANGQVDLADLATMLAAYGSDCN